MGDLNVRAVRDEQDYRDFMNCMLKDLHALEYMLKEGWFESGITRIGAEQEMCLVDHRLKPSHHNLEALEKIDSSYFTTELARFNLEANLDPLEFRGDCLSVMHKQLKRVLEEAQLKTKDLGADLLLTGILPSIRRMDVGIDKITPLARYHALMQAIQAMRGAMFELRLDGIDELNVKQQTAMLEACNTSFQVHFQVSPDDFACLYNIAQAITGPVMAVAVNSPMLFGRRLWKETRIALFQQSIDVRVFSEHIRDRSPRVTFGNNWIKNSITEIYQEDIARFQILLRSDVDEDVKQMIKEGKTPKLRALNIHNSTVYRWNRPCYGISDNGKPHMRIENRIFPAGPSVPDEMANAAFWLGLMNGMRDSCPDVTKRMTFDHAKSNFFAAARFGLDTKFTWFDGQKITPAQLILEQLLPIARHGLEKANIDETDISTYLGIIEARADSGRTGSQWILDSYDKLVEEGSSKDEVSTFITAAIQLNQQHGRPIHTWELASTDYIEYRPDGILVEEFMQTDLITVQETDLLSLVTNLINWRKVRHILVENREGNLVGLVTARAILRYHANHQFIGETEKEMTTVEEVMRKEPVTIEPEGSIMHAMELMNTHRVGCLPVVKGDQLVGVITKSEFLEVTSNLMRRLSRK
ncbi:MAG: glutamate-cysteine ligase family protein [Bacteroidota bacterium]